MTVSPAWLQSCSIGGTGIATLFWLRLCCGQSDIAIQFVYLVPRKVVCVSSIMPHYGVTVAKTYDEVVARIGQRAQRLVCWDVRNPVTLEMLEFHNLLVDKQ